jgi:hypothetical protein
MNNEVIIANNPQEEEKNLLQDVDLSYLLFVKNPNNEMAIGMVDKIICYYK